MYKDAFERVFGILEDSGWHLAREGEEEHEEGNSFDDLPSLGYIQHL